MAWTSDQIETAIQHLQRVDPVMRALIDQAGPFTLKLERDRFGMLVRSILSQQISTKAARSIRLKLEERLKPHSVSAAIIQEQSEDELRAVGLSRQKVSYLKDLAGRVLDKRLRLDQVGRLSDEAAIDELIQVKGIGRWTAQMFLMFSLGRLDVFPHEDLVIRSSIQELYQFEGLPSKRELLAIAKPWKPYSTVASWYCWRSIDVKKNFNPD
jgi:DNA-3-methyladenine glycosylase II